MFDMLGKLGEVKKAMDEIKARLDTVMVDGEAGEGSIRVTMTGNRLVKSIVIADKLMAPDRKEELQELLELAVNRASEKAQNVSEAEMKAAGQGLLPNIPGLF
ncbi:MAG: YbaB/EbfC family nucleoid-associated protein [Bacteroidia bacterium]|nr:YbaB/EbfC family nucleoid-associated protein [Bacteroidota bacterium]MBK7969730.1 YbaB/EbfC family nucleoid-associated protein [Bacteroidota bacterium]MBK8874882.1 YbaB/EbfC family nucleoid-associated protein [Bacteroidota bacterium]MBK9425620.1 YbaB/EbfC family nucleoid-associated protein [Bacteroidota bacterium]MBP9081901.1 YbaB/EbfC family nucleoid-associated protein [Bacteroidia bacterium]